MNVNAMLPPPGWRYANLTDSRRQTLEKQVRFGRLLDDLVAHSHLCGINVCEPCDEAKRDKVVANRVSFQLQPTTASARDTLDRLLNGAFGLRARYCVSPEEGSRATAFVCREVAGAIRERNVRLGSGETNDKVAALIQAMGPSLDQASAKVWFDPATDKRAATFDDGQVSSAIWDQGHRQPELVQTTLSDLSAHQIEFSMAKGRTVPLPAFLDIKGAFVTGERIEYVPASKRTRALQIHLMGWT